MRTVAILVFDTSTSEVCCTVRVTDSVEELSYSSSEYGHVSEAGELMAKAVDAGTKFWRHGLLYAEPIGTEGWIVRRWGL